LAIVLRHDHLPPHQPGDRNCGRCLTYREQRAASAGKYVPYTPETLGASGRVTGEANEECIDGRSMLKARGDAHHIRLAVTPFRAAASAGCDSSHGKEFTMDA